MHLKLLIVSASAAVLAFGAASASAATTIIGSSGQSSSQGANSTQAGQNGSGGTSTFILGNSAPTETQTSTNTLTNGQSIGVAGGTTTLIANGAGACFCQSSQQGVNSSQVGVNGDGGTGTTAIIGNSSPSLTQGSNNTQGNSQMIGASATILAGTGICVVPPGVTPVDCTVPVIPNPLADQNAGLGGNQCRALRRGLTVACLLLPPFIPAVLVGGTSVIIGGTAQANTQGTNSSQAGKNGSGGGGLLFVGGPGGSTPALNQVSANDLDNTVIIGG